MSLFRQEVVENRKPRLFGQVLIPTHFHYSIFTYLLLLIFILAAFILTQGVYTRSERAQGQIVPSNGIVKVVPRSTGVVSQIAVSEGDVVRKGQKLFTVDAEQFDQNGHSVDTNADGQLSAEIAQAKQKIKLEERGFQLDLRILEADQSATEAQIKTLENTLDLQEKIVSSRQQSLVDSEQLRAKGHISRLEFEARNQAYLLASQELERLRNELAAAQSQKESFGSSREKLSVAFDTHVNQIQTQILQLQQEQLERSAKRSFSVSSPIDGRISSAFLKPGTAVDPKTVTLSILPENSELVAELYVPTKAAAFIENGQQVQLAFDAFPQHQYGTFPGVIEQITGSAILPNENISGLPIKEPVYRVTVRLQHQVIWSGAKKIALQPGLKFQASIILDRKPFINWILEPFKILGQQL